MDQLAYKIRLRDIVNITVEFDSPSYTDASVISLTPAASTMFLTTNFLMALSFGTQRAQFVHLTGLT